MDRLIVLREAPPSSQRICPKLGCIIFACRIPLWRVVSAAAEEKLLTGTSSSPLSSSASFSFPAPPAPAPKPPRPALALYCSAIFLKLASESGPSWFRIPGTSSVNSFSCPCPYTAYVLLETAAWTAWVGGVVHGGGIGGMAMRRL